MFPTESPYVYAHANRRWHVCWNQLRTPASIVGMFVTNSVHIARSLN